VIAGLPGERAGLRAGDSVVAVNEVPVRSFSDIVAQVAPSAGKPVPFDIVRRGSAAVQRLTIVPAPTEDADPATGQRTSVGKIGAAPRDMSRHEEVALGEAIGAGARATWAMAGDVVGVVHGLFARRVSFKQLGGPIAIARTSVAAARNGLEPLLLLLAFLSVNIAVLNLLPIPILDGGQIVLNVLETIKGSAFSVRTREYIVRVGLVFIGLLFVTVMWNDITRWVGELVR
jgi:regulator of sigma E protease